MTTSALGGALYLSQPRCGQPAGQPDHRPPGWPPVSIRQSGAICLPLARQGGAERGGADDYQDPHRALRNPCDNLSAAIIPIRCLKS